MTLSSNTHAFYSDNTASVAPELPANLPPEGLSEAQVAHSTLRAFLFSKS